MTWNTPYEHRKRLGIKPTEADHRMVRSLSLVGVTVRDLCERMGAHYQLGKPMARVTLYYHFKKDLMRQRRKSRTPPEKSEPEKSASSKSDAERLIEEIRERTAKKNAEKTNPI